MKKLTILSALIAFFAVSGLKAQAQKIAFVNISKIADTLPEMDTINAKIQAKYLEIQEDLAYMEGEIKRKEEALPKMTPANQQMEGKLIEQLYANYQQRRGTAQQELEQFQGVTTEPLLAMIKTAVGEVAKLKSYTQVINNTQGIVIYSLNNNDDITDSVIKYMLGKSTAPRPAIKAAVMPK